MRVPLPTPTTSCCGTPIRTWHSQGDSRADETLCDVCSNETCSRCAASFESEDGYGDDGRGVRTRAVCQSCAKEAR